MATAVDRAKGNLEWRIEAWITLVLFPVRTVLWVVHIGERLAGRSFDFADDNWWIGVASALIGGAIVALAFVVVRTAARALRR